MKITCTDIEIAVANLFGIRRNIIVPNISWGAGLHECDLLIITPLGYATEVEIKVSKADLKKDFEKRHNHFSSKIKNLYYAVPPHLLEAAIELVPAHAGIIVVDRKTDIYRPTWIVQPKAVIHRKAKPAHKFRPMTEKEVHNIARLGTMRVWALKQRLTSLSNNYKSLKSSK